MTNKDVVTGGVKPTELYDNFAKAVYTRPHNFLSLLGLEYRNFLRDRALSLGKALNSLDETAFFYHQACVNEDPNGKEYFSFFLKDIWSSQVAGEWRGHSPEMLDMIDEYKTLNKLDEKIKTLKDNPSGDLEKSIAELNVHYSILEKIPKPPNAIRFGDIFQLDEAKGYLLCITSHCDCLRPSKVSGGFLFVEGQEMSLRKGLEQADTGFVSFIHKDDGKPGCIEWKHNPLMIFVDHEKLDLRESLNVNHKGVKANLLYKCTLKENFTQRMANNAFSHANRVGITLAKLIIGKE